MALAAAARGARALAGAAGAAERRVTVVHGASGGIGLEFARQLAVRGDCVVAACRTPERSAALKALEEAHPGAVTLVRYDACDEAVAAEAVARVAELHGGRVDGLINACGLLHDPATGLSPEKALNQLSADAMHRVYAANCVAPAMALMQFAPLLQAGGAERNASHGHAVAATLSARVGSIGDNKMGGWYSYRASKAALNQTVVGAALELGRAARASKGRKRHVACVALHPGTVDTRLSSPFSARVKPEKLFSPERSVRDLLAVISNLSPAESGGFLAYDGSAIPW